MNKIQNSKFKIQKHFTSVSKYVKRFSNISILTQNYRPKLRTFYFLLVFLTFAFLFLTLPLAPVLAGPASTNFQLLDYGFGAGGTASSSSESFLLQGIAGEIETASPSSANFILGPGLTYTMQPNLPPAPQFTNPGSYYDKLKIIINSGGNSNDTTFAIGVSKDSFVSNVSYVQTDDTLGQSPVWQTYTAWNSGTGFLIIGLNPAQTYYARVAAKRGTFTQGAFGPMASAATIDSTFTFSVVTTSQSVPPFSVNLGELSPGSVITSSDQVTATISTNASNGGLIYINDTNSGLESNSAGNYVISSGTNDLDSLLEGYGAQGTSVTQTSGGPMEINSPYNGSGQNVGVLDTNKRQLADSSLAPVTSGQVSFSLKAKAKTTTPAAPDYSDILTLIGTGNF